MNDITKELAETLKELRTKFDSRQHLGSSMVRVDAALELYEDACKTLEPVITRVEVITDTREYVNWNPNNKITTSLQDDGKTLKIFVTNTEETMYPKQPKPINTVEIETKRWATALSEFIDKLGGDSPALWEWKGITPTPEKVVECLQELFDLNMQLAADGELESCCVVVELNEECVSGNVLRAIRRPQPTLKSQALKDFETVRKHSDVIPEILDTIEKALQSITE